MLIICNVHDTLSKAVVPRTPKQSPQKIKIPPPISLLCQQISIQEPTHKTQEQYSMITGTLKSQIDKLWENFWTGGVANPITVIEQVTYLMFIKQLDEQQMSLENKANRFKEAIKNPIFQADADLPEGYKEEHKYTQQELRWSNLPTDPTEAFERVRDGIFPFIRTILVQQQQVQAEKEQNEDFQPTVFAKHMKGATFMIPTAALFDKVRTALNNMDIQNRDTKGDLYEYLLSKIASAGRNGQFRTPRHIIKMMVDLMQPSLEDTICDPSSGTCGFLVVASEYLRKNYKTELVLPKYQQHFQNKQFNGVEFDATMIRIGAMNMMQHGINNPQLRDSNALGEFNADLENSYSMILANPPFKGSLDVNEVEGNLYKTVKTKKTELLFLALIVRMLKIGGRAAVIIPDGVLFGSSKAHKSVRKMLVDEQQLDAVISMPSGVFKPYAGVSTAILIFNKTNAGGTKQVWFYDMKADGYSLDDKRALLGREDAEGKLTQTHEESNIADILNRFANRDTLDKKRSRTEQSFFVPVAEIQENDYDLSINRYKEIVYEEIEYDPPKVILERIQERDAERQALVKELLGFLKEV